MSVELSWLARVVLCLFTR